MTRKILYSQSPHSLHLSHRSYYSYLHSAPATLPSLLFWNTLGTILPQDHCTSCLLLPGLSLCLFPVSTAIFFRPSLVILTKIAKFHTHTSYPPQIFLPSTYHHTHCIFQLLILFSVCLLPLKCKLPKERDFCLLCSLLYLQADSSACHRGGAH